MINPEDKVVSREMCEKLQPIMGDVETEKVWRRYFFSFKGGYWGEWSLINSKKVGGENSHMQTVPAYDLADMLGRLPLVLETKKGAFCLEHRMLEGKLGYRKIGYSIILKEVEYNSRKDTSRGFLQATSSLLLWAHEQGYLTKEEEG